MLPTATWSPTEKAVTRELTPGHHTGEFVPRNQGRFRPLAEGVQGVQVGVAYAAVVDPHRDVVRAQVAALQRRAPQRRRAGRLPSGGRAHGTP